MKHSLTSAKLERHGRHRMASASDAMRHPWATPTTGVAALDNQYPSAAGEINKCAA
ncbi:hypothetical protein [Carnimonas bestiolae]|uniref:hypothetical protein n=1 Tax=Carnimonas bestiolae TaxID=3402172 RepID=UPI003F4AF5CD